MVTRFAAIFLIAMMTLNLPYLSQLVKLPLLIEHYQEHHQQSATLSFTDFLVLHYQNAPAHDSHDNSLPFKVAALSHQSNILLSVPVSVIFVPAIQHTTTAKSEPFTPQTQLPPGSVSGIFQPPKA